MQESLRDSHRGRQAQGKAWKQKKYTTKRHKSDSDGDDDYFDRTGHTKGKVCRQEILTAQSLVNKLQDLREEERGLAAQLLVQFYQLLLFLLTTSSFRTGDATNISW